MAGQQKYTNTDSNPKNLNKKLKQNRRLEDNRLSGTLFFMAFVLVGIIGLYMSLYPTNKQDRLSDLTYPYEEAFQGCLLYTSPSPRDS